MRQFRLSHKYDPALDSETWDCLKPYFGNMPLWKRQLNGSRMSAARGKNMKAITRVEVETRAAEIVRGAVKALEFIMAEMMQTPAPSGQYDRQVNQLQLHNAIVHLRTKCAVRFDDAGIEYQTKVRLDPGLGDQNA